MAYISFQPNDFFNTLLYTGDGQASRSVTGVGFQPDWVWFKNRSTTDHHKAFDVVRGANKVIYPNLNNAEATVTQELQSFNSDGFTVGTESAMNGNGNNIASWNWKAGGAASTNSNGSVSASVSASTTSGFSVVKYTNPSSGSPFTVGHGLGAAPKCIFVKNLASQNWGVWHTGLGFGKYLQLNTTVAEGAANLVTATSSTTFSTYYDHHTSGAELIAYCFAPVKGFSKFGVYYGDGSADGPFIYTGFKPGLIILKRAGNAGNNWNMIDSKRNLGNDVDKILFPSSNDAEVTTTVADINSNGFKIRLTSSGWNHNQDKFIYLAFAEEPLVSSNNIPATAR
tara:strand:+ start:1507 stop:2526 length:1020 start_codon:yes stop_codon:yes gene_type:complete